MPTIRQWDIRKEDTVVVVDGANDLKLFALAGYTVGFCPVDMVREKADVSIDKRDLSLLLNLLKKNFGEAVLINASKQEALATNSFFNSSPAITAVDTDNLY